MPAVNEIVAVFGNRSECTTATVYQYNYGERLRIVKDDLPEHYRVDFANSVSGQSKSMLGSADGVLVPYEYFVPGSYIHAWIVLVGEDYAVTRYHITIPISPRAVPTEEQPSPEQESIIDQTIAALNNGVERSETAADNAEAASSHYPRIQNGYWEIWDPASGAYVSTGVQAQGPQGEPGTSPEISVAPISGGHRITITDVDGTKTVDVMDGENGVGISSIVKTGTSGLVDTYTITYTDGNATTFAVTNGEDGAPGVSPVITVTDITGGHRVTIADAEHPQDQSFDVMDGDNGVGVPAGGTTGQVLGKSSGTDYDTAWVDKDPVVQVSGTTPTITALPGVRYVCGEVATLDITLPASGCIDVVFESGSTPTMLTITPPTGVTLKWANGFDPDALDANTTYEINIMCGLGVASSWT